VLSPLLSPLYAPVPAGRPELRIGVILDGWTVASWMAEVLSSVQDCGFAQITTIVLNAGAHVPQVGPAGGMPASAAPGSGPQKSNRLFEWYLALDARRHAEMNAPFVPVNVQGMIAAAKVLEIPPLRDGGAQRVSAADCAALRAENLDVILHLGSDVLSGDILRTARNGVWSYHHGDDEQYWGGPPSFWEMYERNPVTATVLQVLADEPAAGKVIYRTHGATRSFESITKSREWIYRKAMPLVVRCLRRLHADGPGGFADLTGERSMPRRRRQAPANRQMALFLARLAWQAIVTRIRDRRGITHDHWFLAWSRGVKRSIGPADRGDFKPLHPPKGRFWADPMVVKKNGSNYVFFEEFDYLTDRGHIAVLRIDAAGTIGDAQVALRADHHLSYPFLFEWQGTQYMIPETACANAVKLYRAVDFPGKWEFVKNLLEGVAAVDATLHQHEGRWYLFANVGESGGSSWDELFLFVAESPLGPWRAHPKNPIVSDVRGARPAGPLFSSGPKLYRPAQNCGPCYGHSIAVFEIDKLTPLDYAERFSHAIEPDWLSGIHGCHTLSCSEDLTVLDCKTTGWRPFPDRTSELLHARSWARLKTLALRFRSRRARLNPDSP